MLRRFIAVLITSAACGALAACGGLAASDDPRPENCGDGLLDPHEYCDLGEANSDNGECTTLCRFARCGDGLLGPGETCDDGNTEAGDDCDTECHSRFDFAWATSIAGVQAMSASAGGPVYVTGEMHVYGDPEIRTVAVVDRATGAVTMGAPWYQLPILAFSERGDLHIAARPGGGAVVAAHFSFSGELPVAVAGWFAPTGEMEARYESPPLGVTHTIHDVAIGAGGEALLGGSWDDVGWAFTLKDDEVQWNGLYDASGDVVVTSVDVDGTSRGLVAGYRAPQFDPFLALDEGGGVLAWSFIQPRMEEDSFEDIRFGGDSGFWVAHVRRQGGTAIAIEHRALSNGQTDGTVMLEVPTSLELRGVRILPGGRALTWGRKSSAHWLALHAEDGAMTWRANSVQLTSDVLDADSDAEWVFGIVGGVAVVGWQVSVQASD
jgi:cysteine-rich repeat protein